MLKGLAKLFVCGHSNRECSGTDICIHQSFRCVYDSPNEWCEAILALTERVQHHDPDFSSYLQGLHNKINAFMDKVILMDTTNFPILVEEFQHRKNSKKHECMMRHFHLEIHDDVSKADKKGMGDPISSHFRDIHFF